MFTTTIFSIKGVAYVKRKTICVKHGHQYSTGSCFMSPQIIKIKVNFALNLELRSILSGAVTALLI